MVDEDSRAYRDVVRQFAEHGASLIRATPEERYGISERETARILKPGFIPIARPPRVVLITYYPNAVTLKNVETAAMHERVATWGVTGAVDDYAAAYDDFLVTMPRWPFYTAWMKQIMDEVELGWDEIAWLPLVKLPGSSKKPPTDAMMQTDREELKLQLAMLPRSISWVQSDEVQQSAGGAIERASRAVVVQKIPNMQKSATHPGTPKVIRELRKALRESAI